MDKTQKQRVYEYMKRHGSITTMQAFRDLNITRLSARIYDLRHDGIPIEQTHVVVKKGNKRTDYDKFFIAESSDGVSRKNVGKESTRSRRGREG